MDGAFYIGDVSMEYSKMILFDYGHTLLYEPDWNSAEGMLRC